MPDAATLDAGAHDQADREAGDHVLQVDASGRRAMRSWPVQILQGSHRLDEAKHRKSGARFAC
jgi:hypothetical protein